MALPFFNWSRTAASNATADSTVNWAEGQTPSSINDSARAMMASAAAFRDDISGAITTAGTSTAYTVTSYQVFDTLAHLNGQMIAFVPNASNTNTVGNDVTLNVDGLGAKPIRMQPSVPVPSGTLILGTPYIVTYNNSDSVFYLQNMTNPYNIPVGSGIDYWGTIAPNSSFAFPFGQALSRTTYASLFTLFSTTYGAGDGSTTFNLPDKRGRVSACPDSMGGGDGARLNTSGSSLSANRFVLGAAGGTSGSSLGTSNLPPYTPAGNVSTTFNASTTSIQSTSNGGSAAFATSSSVGSTTNMQGALGQSATSTFTGSAQGGTSTGFDNIQPTILCNYILRVI